MDEFYNKYLEEVVIVKMNTKIKKILIIISIIIIILGIISGLSLSNELINSSDNNIYIDGTDFSGIAEIISFMGSKILGILIVIYSLLLDVAIWTIYWIIILIIKIVKWLKNKRK